MQHTGSLVVQPANRPPERRSAVRLLTVDSAVGAVGHGCLVDLTERLATGDLLVVNDAATLPGSLNAHTDTGAAVEMRLLGQTETGDWRAVLFGAGDWHTDTDARPAPPTVVPGDTIHCQPLSATVTWVSPESSRLVEMRFDRSGAALWSWLYRLGAPVQYAHVSKPLPLWSVQTVYGARPWAAEMPSAGRPLSWSILLALRQKGIDVAAVTHAAGLSATGDPALDGDPLPERFEISPSTVAAVMRTRARGGRVIAVGTTVVRAIEGSVQLHGDLRPGSGVTDLVIGPHTRPRYVDGVITGMHAPGESHYELLRAFVDESLLRESFEQAVARGYRCHEFGDVALFAPWISS